MIETNKFLLTYSLTVLKLNKETTVVDLISQRYMAFGRKGRWLIDAAE